MNKKIRLLDESTINRIAAGEIIDQPSSIVKELIENSIDAESKNITIEIKNGGKSYIRVTDDGIGISEENLPYAFLRHSTSKINNIDDIYNIESLGFRGEALASIAAVSKMSILTKTQDSLVGNEANLEDGEIIDIKPIGSPQGTTIIVEDLFYSLPARKKFLKTDLVEFNRISEVVYTQALGNPTISFNFISDKNTVFKTNRTTDRKNHLHSILGREISNNLMPINRDISNLNINGFISNNKIYRGNRSFQYLYVNNRPIKNDKITNTIESVYRSVIPINRFPIFILNLNLDPNLVDVNIHPTKKEVHFSNENMILSSIKEAITEKLDQISGVMEISKNKDEKINENDDLLINLFDNIDSKSNIIESNISDIFTDNKIYEIKDLRSTKKIDNYQIEDVGFSKEFYVKEENITKENKTKKEIYENDTDKKNNLELINLNYIGTIFNTYILAEDKLEKTLYIVDQHAAHERVMYEKFLKQYYDEEINSQILVTPYILDLNTKDFNIINGQLDLLNSLGFEIESFGYNKLAIRSIPIIFGNPNLDELLENIIVNLDENIQTSYQLYLEKIMKIACVNSVKSGDNLNELEIKELFEDLKKASYPYTCPHGRPTILKIGEKELEKEFLRIQ